MATIEPEELVRALRTTTIDLTDDDQRADVEFAIGVANEMFELETGLVLEAEQDASDNWIQTAPLFPVKATGHDLWIDPIAPALNMDADMYHTVTVKWDPESTGQFEKVSWDVYPMVAPNSQSGMWARVRAANGQVWYPTDYMVEAVYGWDTVAVPSLLPSTIRRCLRLQAVKVYLDDNSPFGVVSSGDYAEQGPSDILWAWDSRARQIVNFWKKASRRILV